MYATSCTKGPQQTEIVEFEQIFTEFVDFEGHARSDDVVLADLRHGRWSVSIASSHLDDVLVLSSLVDACRVLLLVPDRREFVHVVHVNVHPLSMTHRRQTSQRTLNVLSVSRAIITHKNLDRCKKSFCHRLHIVVCTEFGKLKWR